MILTSPPNRFLFNQRNAFPIAGFRISSLPRMTLLSYFVKDSISHLFFSVTDLRNMRNTIPIIPRINKKYRNDMALA